MFNQQEYINKFIKDNYKTVKLRIRNDDKLVLNKIKNVENINRYIYDLILKDIYQNRVYHYIDNNVTIDFELSKTMKDLVDKAEYADMIDDYGLYMNLADAIDSQGKKETNNRTITETEWKRLVRRYAVWLN